jgi:hypothetical protein
MKKAAAQLGDYNQATVKKQRQICSGPEFSDFSASSILDENIEKFAWIEGAKIRTDDKDRTNYRYIMLYLCQKIVYWTDSGNRGNGCENSRRDRLRVEGTPRLTVQQMEMN